MKHHAQTKSYLQRFSVILSQSLLTPRPGFKLMQLECVGEVRWGPLSWRRRKHEEEEARATYRPHSTPIVAGQLLCPTWSPGAPLLELCHRGGGG